MSPEEEWAEVARIQECLRTARDPDRPAEERLAAIEDFFAWLDREGFSPDFACIATDAEITPRDEA
jgi:hypothetical protein